jgi:magnesium chelatase family protein
VTIKLRVEKARKIQRERYSSLMITTNDQLSTKSLGQYCKLNNDSILILKSAIDQYQLSARAYTRILKVARTIADIEQSNEIKTAHLAEALGYRCDKII